VSRPERVVLVNMPMGLVQVPNLGLSLLKPALARAGMQCSVRYFSVELLDRFVTGEEILRRYVELVEEQRLASVGASSFAARRFGPDPVRERMAAEHLARADDSARDLLVQIDAAVDPFLEHCVAAEDWDDVAIVGFTDLFAGMTIPAAVLALELKRRFPHLVTVLGGWNTNGPMGEVIAERLPEFDFVLRGEADESVVTLFSRVLAGEDPDGVPGLVRRDPSTGEVRSWPQRLVHGLDDLPFPDFSDYFEALARSRFPVPQRMSLPFESARGCWWGAVSHCRFCGLNGLSMPYRSKSPERALAEIDHIVERHAPRMLFATDTVLDRAYFKSLLPQLRERHPDLTIAYEVKAPVRRHEMEALADAGIEHVTVGIETLSTRLLDKLQKGSTYLHNVHCLRLGAEVGVRIGWQYLYGLPEEHLEDYETAVSEMPWLIHLEPPLQACPITLARFSPYFEQASRLAVTAVRAHPDYRLSYDWPQEALDRVAYHFVFDHGDGRADDLLSRIRSALDEGVEGWQRHHAAARLDLYRSTHVLAIVDTRLIRPRVYVLTGAAKSAYEALDAPATASAVERALRDRPTMGDGLLEELTGWRDEDDSAVLRHAEEEAARLGTDPLTIDGAAGGAAALLDTFAATGLARSEGDHHLALAVPRPLLDASGAARDVVAAAIGVSA
jgi:ribosomal peptide maturation radical SAM protein 1